MAIPNISDYFRSQQQFGRSLDEQRRQFDAAKEQRDQQFYTNMFVSPLMQMGTGSLGKFIGEQMPLEQEKLKGMQIENEAAGLRKDRLGMGRAAEDAMGHIFTGSPEAANPTVVAPPKPTAPTPGRQGMFTPSGIEPTPSPNTNLFAGLPKLSDMYGSGGSHAGVPFSAGGDGGPNVDPGATDGGQSVVPPLPGEGPPTAWEDTANRYWAEENPFATRPDPEARAMDSVAKEIAEQNPASRAPDAVPLLRSDTEYDWNYLQPLMANGATGIGAPFGGTASPQAAKVKQAVDRVIAQRAAAKVPPGDAMNPSPREIAWKDTPPMRAQSAAPRGPAMQLPGLQSTAAPQMSMGRPAAPTPPSAPPSTGVPFGRGVEDAGLGERGPVEQGVKDIGSMRVEPTSAFANRPTDFDPYKARAMMPQEAAAALLEKYGKYGFTPDHLDRLVKQADAQQDLALGQQNAAVRERGETTLQRATDSIKDLGTQEIHVGKMSFKVPKYELNPVAKAMVDRGMDVPMSMLITPLDGKAVGVEMMKFMPRGGGGAKGGFIGGDGQIYTGPVVDSTYEGLKLGGHFKSLGIDLPKNPTQAQKGAIITSLRFHPGGKEALDGILGVKVGTSANIASSLASLFTNTASKEKIAGDKNATAEKIAGDKNATTVQVTSMKLSGEEKKAKIAQKTAILGLLKPNPASKTKSDFLIRTNAAANGKTPAQYRASLQKTLDDIENDLKQSAE